MTNGIIRIIGLVAATIGVGATLLSDWVDEKKMEIMVEEKVNEAMARDKENES